MDNLEQYGLNLDALDDLHNGESMFEIIPPRDSRRKVKKNQLDDAPFRYICNLVRVSDGLSRGTGTLIGARTLLTAGHNIEGQSSTNIKIIPARHGNDAPLFGTAVSTSLKLPADYVKGTGTDYGIVILDKEIGKTSGYWGFQHKRWSWDSRGTSILPGRLPFLPGNFKVNLAGYPQDLPKEDPDAGPCKRRISKARFMYRVYDTTVRRFRDTPPGLLEYKNDTCPGMSGSPVWIKRSRWVGGRVMIAIHIRRDVPETTGTANAGVLIGDDVRTFILRHIK